jgi:hypothetical protein
MSSSSEKVRNKDITSFHRLCKDLYKFIQKRIIRKYVNPQIIYEPVNSLGTIISRNKEWKYFNTKEKISEEEKILDIFKDNAFLAKLKAYYESLEIIINTLDENEKNVELLQKDIELGEKKLEMLSKLNTQLNQLFSMKDNTSNNNSNNNSNNSSKSKGNKNNVLDKIHLVKSLNILNELQFFNNNNNNINGENDKFIKNNNTTSNTTITNNNNIILDNKIINNNIRESKSVAQKEKDQIPLKEEKNRKDNNTLNKPNNSSKQKNKINLPQKPKDNSASDVKLLNRKVKRDNSHFKEEEEIFSESSSKKNVSLINPNFINNNVNNNIINESDNNANESNQPSPPPQINNVSNNNQNIINISVDKEPEQPKNKNPENVNNPNSNEEKIENKENYDDQTNLEIEFEKVLKDKFSFVYNSSQNKIPKYKKDIMSEINSVLKRIPNLKYNKKDKFDDPYIVGSYSHFDVINLMDYVPPIDIMFKCKNIKSVKELKDIVDETMKKKMGFNYLEIGTEYDRKNEIVKYFHKCKVTKGQKDNNLFFFFNIIFVGINLSNFNQKETSINRFYFNNNGMYDNKGKILISLYFRRWRKKYNLSFMMPEFIDIIINYYYSDKNNLSFTIEEIFLALFNGHFRFLEKKEGEENDNINAAEDVENLKDIKKYILEWYNNQDFRKKMSDAIMDTQELIMNSKFYNTFNTEIDE